jgi:hypothetical protein
VLLLSGLILNGPQNTVLRSEYEKGEKKEYEERKEEKEGGGG